MQFLCVVWPKLIKVGVLVFLVRMVHHILNVGLASYMLTFDHITEENLSITSVVVCVYWFGVELGPVVQKVVSLTSSLRVSSLTFLADSIHNILIFFAEKM